jgi:hypothetical protein
MRRHRTPLVLVALFVVAYCVTLFVARGTASPEEAQWKSSPTPVIHSQMRSVLLTTANLQPLAEFAAAMNSSTSRSVTSTTAVPIATPSNAAAWACIELHESGDGSGSSDLYGLEPPAWAEYGDPAYSWAGAAPPGEQLAAAERVWTANGDSWAHGAWSTAGVCGLD